MILSVTVCTDSDLGILGGRFEAGRREEVGRTKWLVIMGAHQGCLVSGMARRAWSSRSRPGGQLGRNRVVSGSFPLFNSYYLQACGEWLEGSTRAVGTRADFCSGLSWPGPGLGCKFNLSSTANGASVGSMVPRGCIIRGWVGDAVRVP
jgi:hypothetical protein